MATLSNFFTSLQARYTRMLRYAEIRAKYQASIVSGVHESLVSEDLFEKGIGYVIMSRKLITGEIAAGVFRVDVFCLGVRKAYANILEESVYNERIQKTGRQSPLVSIHPACCRKLVEQVTDFALSLGFAPQREYEIAGKIFGNLDAGICPKKFEFGKNGRPTFIPRPEDTPDRRKRILELLQSICGPQGFDYIKK
ncbi:MAG: hypothetical protein PHO79_08925 [Desulfoplanes sp.]|nr:hypothetical protein [Desulfoplanes sp.]